MLAEGRAADPSATAAVAEPLKKARREMRG
jgi:hypothetical protein